jgi:heat shock protein HtpX
MRTRVRVGLWARIAVAAAVALSGLSLLLVVEFAIATFASLLLLAGAAGFGVVAWVLAAILASAVLCWKIVALLLRQVGPAGMVSGRISSDVIASGVAQIGQGLRNPPAVRELVRPLGVLVGGGFGLIVGHYLIEEVWKVNTWIPSMVLGAIAVLAYTGWLVQDEITSGNGVQTDIEEEYSVIDDPEREATVERRLTRLAKQANCPVPEVRIGASWLPQAATVGYRPTTSEMVVTRGLVDTLDERELDAVLAHELAHLINRDAAVLTVLTVPRTKAGVLAMKVPWLGLVFSLPVYLTNRLAVPLVARYREFVADEAATELTGDPAALASALATIDEEYQTGPTADMRMRGSAAAFGIVPPPWEERKILDGTMRFVYRGLLGTHPPTADRIERLQSRISQTA